VDEIIVRSLTREYRFRTESPELTKLLAFLSAKPEMVGFHLDPVVVTIQGAGPTLRVQLPTGTWVEGSADRLATEIHSVVFRGVQDEEQAAPLVHGAALVLDSERFILIGPKGSGKTTLTLHLLSRGFDVEGDEHVVLRENDVVARPRAMRIKPGSLGLVPSFAEAILASPFMGEERGGPAYAFDPSLCGRPWHIRAGPAHHLVFIEANHGGTSSIRRLEPEEAFRQLAEHCLLPASGRAVAAARLRRLAHEAKAWVLSLGDLEQGEQALRDLGLGV
jgi:hypothetical protein